ncbi:hypothetical protein FBU30_005679 [Linnemannia zychae]|nr:hypothetical protein FBU30_005679 [Linnemannia zychae]
MVHHKFKTFHERHPDLSAISHFDFFDSALDLTAADACHIWLSCMVALAKDANPAIKTTIASLKETYLKDKKNGTLRQYWDRRRLKQEAENSKAVATMQTAITLNRTTARVMQSVEKQAESHLGKIDDIILGLCWAFVDAPNTPVRKILNY